MIKIMAWNADSVCGVYIMERIRPVIICRDRVIPRRNPMFHIKEMEEGVGRSISDFFTMLRIGFLFISCIFIRKKTRLSGSGGDPELRWPLL